MLDGVLYHESDLDLEEHYTDTHGYTEIIFAAFGMVGMRFCPRIRSLHRPTPWRGPSPTARSRSTLPSSRCWTSWPPRAGWYTFVSAQAHAIATGKAPWVPALGLDAERGQIPDHAPVAQS